jgi:hypothetical protein
MDIYINHNKNININYLTLQKMTFLFNALEDGWEIKKIDNKYFFVKKHEGKKEVFSDNYLKRFLEQNFDVNKILSEN